MGNRFKGTSGQSAPGEKTPYFPIGEHVVQVTKFFSADSQRGNGWYTCFEGKILDSTVEDAIGIRHSHVINSKHGDDIIIGISKGIAIALGADVDKLSDPEEADDYMNALTDVGVNGLSEEFQVQGEGVLLRVNVFNKEGKTYNTHVYTAAQEQDYELL